MTRLEDAALWVYPSPRRWAVHRVQFETTITRCSSGAAHAAGRLRRLFIPAGTEG